MIWFDLVTPKSVLFFKPVLEKLREAGARTFVTTRAAEGYDEVVELLKLNSIEHHTVGSYGGGDLKAKFRASLDRQKLLFDMLQNADVTALVCISAVDSVRAAYGMGIPVFNFNDIPVKDFKKNPALNTPQAKLTIPLSKYIFRPFIIPADIYEDLGLVPENIFEYKFIDPAIWLREHVYNKAYAEAVFAKYGADTDGRIILVREEEYKSSYVDSHVPHLYDALPALHRETGAEVAIIPRYEDGYLRERFPFARVIGEKVKVQHLLQRADLFIGGGGTMNTEAVFLGTPAVSTRSFVCHYDKWQMDSGLMVHAENPEDIINAACGMLSRREDEKACALLDGMRGEIDVFLNNFINQLMWEYV
jgi:predicted glycosyltransferase